MAELSGTMWAARRNREVRARSWMVDARREAGVGLVKNEGQESDEPTVWRCRTKGGAGAG